MIFALNAIVAKSTLPGLAESLVFKIPSNSSSPITLFCNGAGPASPKSEFMVTLVGLMSLSLYSSESSTIMHSSDNISIKSPDSGHAFRRSLLISIGKATDSFQTPSTVVDSSFNASSILSRLNLVDMIFLFSCCFPLRFIIINLHSFGKFGRTKLSLESCHTQLVLPFILILPVESLINETSGVI